MLHAHGTDDPMVAFAMAQKTTDAIKAQGHTDYTLRHFPGMGHTVSPEELGVCVDFLRKVLPADGGVVGPAKAPEEMSIKELKAAIQRGGLGSKAVGLREKQELVDLLKSKGNDEL